MAAMAQTDSYLLALYDISGIQEYIFATNRMKENVGASRIVGDLMRSQLIKVLKEHESIKVDWQKDMEIELFSNSEFQAEVVFIGGGNALVIYRDHNLCQKVFKEISIKLIEKSYTLTLIAETLEFSYDKTTSYYPLYQELQDKLARKKEEMVRPKPFGALPISAQEHFGGFPITYKDNRSTIQALKEQATESIELEDIIDPPPKKRWAVQINDLKKSPGDDSYIAVIHIDGNGMGEQMKRKLQNLDKNGLSFAEQVKGHRELSLQISQGYKDLVQNVMKTISFEKDILPIRPLIMDGDDLTFLCQADWALPLVVEILKRMESYSGDLSLSACAGIAYVHGHFPFDIAYEIAEVCCKEAKKKRSQNGGQGSYIDFQLVRGSDVTARDVTGRPTNPNNAVLGRYRPYRVSEHEKNGVNTLIECIKQLNEKGTESEMRIPRTKQKLMYQAYLKGTEDAIKAANELLGSRGIGDFKETKPWLDAFELADYYEQNLFKSRVVQQ